jgi:y4mF family transcriptional regulator
MEQFQEYLGKQIRDRRNLLHITQGDLAEIAGVSLRSLIDIEQGKGNPSLSQLMKILDVLGMKVEVTNKA